jgi:hypothetical protein
MWSKDVLILFSIVDYKFANWVLSFQDTITFQIAIKLCYNIQSTPLQSYMPSLIMSTMCECFVVNYLWLCFELKLWTLIACECVALCHINLLGHL